MEEGGIGWRLCKTLRFLSFGWAVMDWERNRSLFFIRSCSHSERIASGYVNISVPTLDTILSPVSITFSMPILL